VLAQHLPATALLILSAFIVQQLIALPLGALAAVYRQSLFDGAFSIFSYTLLAIPAFVLGIILIAALGVDAGGFPTGQSASVTLPVLGTAAWFHLLIHSPALVLGDALRHLVMPAMSLALVGIALDSRFMRASMLSVLDEEYIRTARAKGIRPAKIIFKHAFRNAVPPIITNVALYVPILIGSAMVVERIFQYNGIGYLFAQTIQAADYPVVQSILLLLTAVVLIANLLADIAYRVADPRIRHG